MTALNSKRIILAVTGSIAAYKSVVLLRELQKQGAEVRVIMTPSAAAFVSPLTFASLSKHEVHTSVIAEESWNNHVELGLWADVMIVAPCTANTLASLAHGMATNIVHAVYLSAKCPVYFAPAMDLDMWKHPATTNNRNLLKSFGNIEIPVGNGYLASGLEGEGRMAEPSDIVGFLIQKINEEAVFANKNFLITAGPTQEALDPVRYITNHSSGKMGIALADRAAQLGARVTLVLGPTHLRPSHPRVAVISVLSAQDMYEACESYFDSADVSIMAAAVADYTPLTVADQKIKKADDDMHISLKRTIDIAATLGKRKRKNQLLVGFALETQNGLQNAASKVKRKNFDFIVLNTLQDKGAGFGGDTNKVTLINAKDEITHFELKSKIAVAEDILDYLQNKYL